MGTLQHNSSSIEHRASSIEHPQTRRLGFTLIELSIVLVVIGLIVGGIFVGQMLIESARVRSVVTAHELFIQQWNAFRLKYNCLPGDCPNASQFFSGASNGNGDGYIMWSSELAYVWSHLVGAGLVSGGYTGIYALPQIKSQQLRGCLGQPHLPMHKCTLIQAIAITVQQ